MRQLLRSYRFLRPLYAPIINLAIRYNRLRQVRKQYRSEVMNYCERQEKICVIIGAGNTKYRDWIATDYPYLDITNNAHWRAVFHRGIIDNIVSEHVIEHLTQEQFSQFLQIIPPYLSSSANIRVAIPDGNHPDVTYIERVRPGGTGIGADDHKVLYDYRMMGDLLDKYGYQYQFLEYFDEYGQFHKVDWSSEGGHISRSQLHDRRNTSVNPTAYTSLIVDFWRKA